MIFRKATEEDMPEIITLIEEFIEKQDSSLVFTVQEAYIYQLSKTLLSTTFVAEIAGIVVGVCTIKPILIPSGGQPVAHLVIWYIRQGYRYSALKFLDFIEKWCKDSAMSAITVSHLSGSTLGKHYISRGFKPFETHYIKKLGG